MKSADPAPAPAAPPLTETQKLVLGAIGAKIRGKKAYADARRYEEQLKTLAGVGKEIVLPDGRVFVIVDQFAGKSLVKKLTFIDRFELEEVTA